jgi:thiol-disulfide isomerase/thioredoxin
MATHLPLAILIAGVLALPAAHAAAPGEPAPDVYGRQWINSPPVNMASLRNQVVLVEFWTFGCYNCRNVEPYVKDWYRRYRRQGFTVIGVHTPEFDSERDVANVRRYVQRQSIEHPVVMDNDYAIWERYANRYWPALYLIDKRGIVRYVQIGEGGYARTEERIQQLLQDTDPPKNESVAP